MFLVNMLNSWLFSVLVSISVLSQTGGNKFSHGWGDDIEWVSLEKAYELSQGQSKPIMVIIHKTWCGACKSLKAQFSVDQEIAKFSPNLIMVNLEDDEEPDDPQYNVDGGYVPRLFFVSPSSKKVVKDIYNQDGNQQYKYYYYSTDHVLKSMKKATVDVVVNKTEL